MRPCLNRSLLPARELFVVPKQNFYLAVPFDEDNHEDDGFYEDFEQEKRNEALADDYDIIAFASDPYPYFRKVIRQVRKCHVHHWLPQHIVFS